MQSVSHPTLPGLKFSCELDGIFAVQTVILVVDVDVHSTTFLSTEVEWSSNNEVRVPVGTRFCNVLIILNSL